ncbi:TIF1A-like protein [Mya arenaria]|uniref:TIF1A-like protein n=1 Tax=Mya arenaria TaxID=6604 RepID=A0ABY7EQF2_MYAAR|nr:TIF1A-like protein [Mya arenaria]
MYLHVTSGNLDCYTQGNWMFWFSFQISKQILDLALFAKSQMATGGLDDTDISNDLKVFEGPDSTIKLCGPCKHDHREEIARGLCIACCEYLCKTCCREHYKHKVTMYHVILKDQDLPVDIAPFLAIRKLMKCSVHTNEDVSHECVDHSCLICAICIKEEHRQCGEVKKLESENGKDANESDLKNIDSLQIKAMNCKLRSECNILNQLVEKRTADI